MPGFAQAVEQKLERIVEEEMSRHGIPGAVVGVQASGKGVWTTARGLADISSGRSIAPTDRIRIASITKTFTATVLLQLVDESRLSLDDYVDRYAPGVACPPGVTVRQLCNNTSGLFDYFDDPLFLDAITREPCREWLPWELVGISLSHEPYFPPGTGYHYSNTNFILLGIIIEEVTGRSLARAVSERISGPLGLADTLFPESPFDGGPLVRGYRPVAGSDAGGSVELEDVTDFHPSLAWAAGGMVSALEDLLKWAEALASGSLLSEPAAREQFHWMEGSPEWKALARYGLGVTSIGGFIGHEGELLGYNTAMYSEPSAGVTVVVLMNRYTGHCSVAGETAVFLAKVLAPGSLPL